MITIAALDVSVITSAIESLLRDWEGMQSVQIERSEAPNEDPSRCPWVGIYRTGIEFPSRTLGLGPGFRHQRFGLVLLVQASHPESGEKCEAALGELLQKVVSALLSDPSLRGTADVLDEFDVDFDHVKADDQYMQTATLRFVALKPVSGG